MSEIYESITLDLDKITDERIRHIAAATDELMDEKLASIGYVKVVRCRDCIKWSFFDVEDGKRIGDCSEWTHLDGFSHATDENGFCAWGERRDA